MLLPALADTTANSLPALGRKLLGQEDWRRLEASLPPGIELNHRQFHEHNVCELLKLYNADKREKRLTHTPPDLYKAWTQAAYPAYHYSDVLARP